MEGYRRIRTVGRAWPQMTRRMCLQCGAMSPAGRQFPPCPPWTTVPYASDEDGAAWACTRECFIAWLRHNRPDDYKRWFYKDYQRRNKLKGRSEKDHRPADTDRRNSGPLFRED